MVVECIADDILKEQSDGDKTQSDYPSRDSGPASSQIPKAEGPVHGG
jgi:hypothetical protein